MSVIRQVILIWPYSYTHVLSSFHFIITSPLFYYVMAKRPQSHINYCLECTD